MIDLARYKLIIFDKDGTLIDFDAMWSGWVEELAARLETATGLKLAEALYAALDYDAANRRTLAGGRLAVMPMTALMEITRAFLLAQELTPAEAAEALGCSWHIPDPAAAAQPLADLLQLFRSLRERGLKIAVATSDDHAPTVATLACLGVAYMVDAVIAADDGVPLKPCPDMVWAACQATGVEPRETIVVGDALPELQMARAAGAGLAVGVTSGVSDREALRSYADRVLESIRDLMPRLDKDTDQT